MAQINKPTDYFNTVLYSGTGSSNAITGVGFQSDWVWVKNRSTTSNYRMVNAVTGSSELQSSNITNIGADSSYFSSFDSDGFTVGTATDTNNNGSSFVSWNWLASNTTASNTDGSITSTVSVNTTSGFSIVSYTGTGGIPVTVGHGLGVTPEVLIIKNITNALDWAVYHKDLGNTGGVFLNTTSAFTTDADLFNNTSPTSSVVTFSNSTKTNQGSANHIMYAFNSVKGFSKFGSYTGNGSTDGPFVYTAFKPAYVLIKRTDSSTEGYWSQIDNKRDTYNVAQKRLNLNTDSSENSDPNHAKDFLSNGFKIRSSHPINNASGGTYIYMAFAENPLVGTNNIPATAR